MDGFIGDQVHLLQAFAIRNFQLGNFFVFFGVSRGETHDKRFPPEPIGLAPPKDAG